MIPHFRQRILPRMIASLGNLAVKCLALTCRFKIEGGEHLVSQANQGAMILSFWHNRLPFAVPILLRVAPQFTYAAFISDSRDGELIASLVNKYQQVRCIRVPKRSRSHSLKTLVSHLKQNPHIAIITPDGPRGPKYIAKPGIAFAAKEAQVPVISLRWEATRFWQLSTWDQMMIPKPFSTIHVTVDKPLILDDQQDPVAEVQKYLSKKYNYRD